ncbi:MAG: hypothetical protein WDN23_03610 [Edaphobacter sp.]
MKLAGVALMLMTASLMAQEKAFDYHSAAELQKATQQVMAKAVAAAGGSATEKIAESDDHAITVAARVKSGSPEVHDHLTDVITVTGGQATLVIGGTVVGKVAAAGKGPGEWGGTDITGGTVQMVKKGDIISIPAGTPHWIKVAPGDEFSYINVKVKR